MDTNNKLALQILYWLEDRGLSVDYSNWGETAYYRFMDPQDFQNAIYLLRMYCGEKSLLGIDRNRLEIRIDLTSAWTKLKESLDEDKEEILNSSLNKNEDTITEELMESDSVEDDLNEIIEDCLVDFQDQGIKLSDEHTSFEINPIEDLNDSEIDFSTLQVYNETDDDKPKASFMIYGTLPSEDFSYLDTLKDVLSKLDFATGLKPLLYKEEMDSNNNWFAKILLYEDAELEDEEEPKEDLEETYTKDELNSFRNKVFNQRKIMSIYRKKKYGKTRLMCRTKCVNCGREKKLFLSNLVTNPEKYGSCICSDKNIEARYDIINGLYRGTKKLRNNTSGYTGVSWVATYGGEPYNKWRAYIDIDNQRTYLGDFSSKSKAIRARRAAAAKGIKWYQENKDQFMATSRRKRKKQRRAKLKKTSN